MRRTSTTVVRRRPLRRPRRKATATTPTATTAPTVTSVLVAACARLLDLALELADLRLEVAAADRAVQGLRLRVHRPGPFRFTTRQTDERRRAAPPTSTTMRYGTHERFPVKVVPVSVWRARSSDEEQQHGAEPEHHGRRPRRSRGTGRAP